MVRVVHQPPLSVRFERVEHDGRDHSPWALEAVVEPLDTETAQPASLLRMRMHYGGALGGPIVEKLLADEITRSGPACWNCWVPRRAPAAVPDHRGSNLDVCPLRRAGKPLTP